MLCREASETTLPGRESGILASEQISSPAPITVIHTRLPQTFTNGFNISTLTAQKRQLCTDTDLSNGFSEGTEMSESAAEQASEVRIGAKRLKSR